MGIYIFSADFLYAEAEILDERRYDEWLALLADDVRYWMPMRRNVKYGDDTGREFTREGEEIAWFDEGKETQHGFTLSLTVNYLDTGLGETVTAKGFLERRGRTIYFARGEAWVDDKILIASAQGTFKYSSPRVKK